MSSIATVAGPLFCGGTHLTWWGLPSPCLHLLAGLVLVSAATLGPAAAEGLRPYADPARFEEAIQSYEAAEREAPSPTGAVVCIGSSSMGGWHRRLAADLAPLTVIPRGFGGSTMYDALHYADRAVLAHQPRAVLLYEGDNDAAQGIEPDRIRATFDAFAARLHGRLPAARIYVLAIKPSLARWHLWPVMKAANELLQEACAADERLFYIDVATPMLGENGTPRPDIFLDDNLHMNDAGYDIWRAATRPILVEAEAPHEPSPAE